MGKPLTQELISQKAKTDSIHLVKNLNLWGNEIDDISIVKNMPALEVLSLSVNKIGSLQDLVHCKNLQELYLRKNNVSDLSEIKYLVTLQNLRILWLQDNPCAETPNYREIVVKCLPNLIKLDNTNISDDEQLKAQALKLDLQKYLSGSQQDDFTEPQIQKTNSVPEQSPPVLYQPQKQQSVNQDDHYNTQQQYLQQQQEKQSQNQQKQQQQIENQQTLKNAQAIYCEDPAHDEAAVQKICTFVECQEEYRLVCKNCLPLHGRHKKYLIDIKTFVEETNLKYEQHRSMNDRRDIFKIQYESKIKRAIAKKFDELKAKLEKQINEEQISIETQIKNNLGMHDEAQGNNYFYQIREYFSRDLDDFNFDELEQVVVNLWDEVRVNDDDVSYQKMSQQVYQKVQNSLQEFEQVGPKIQDELEIYINKLKDDIFEKPKKVMTRASSQLAKRKVAKIDKEIQENQSMIDILSEKMQDLYEQQVEIENIEKFGEIYNKQDFRKFSMEYLQEINAALQQMREQKQYLQEKLTMKSHSLEENSKEIKKEIKFRSYLIKNLNTRESTQESQQRLNTTMSELDFLNKKISAKTEDCMRDKLAIVKEISVIDGQINQWEVKKEEVNRRLKKNDLNNNSTNYSSQIQRLQRSQSINKEQYHKVMNTKKNCIRDEINTTQNQINEFKQILYKISEDRKKEMKFCYQKQDSGNQLYSQRSD